MPKRLPVACPCRGVGSKAASHPSAHASLHMVKTLSCDLAPFSCQPFALTARRDERYLSLPPVS